MAAGLKAFNREGLAIVGESKWSLHVKGSLSPSTSAVSKNRPCRLCCTCRASGDITAGVKEAGPRGCNWAALIRLLKICYL